MKRKLALLDCRLYQHYAKALQDYSLFTDLTGDFVSSGFCEKAAFYFEAFCSGCKNNKQKGGEER